METLYSCIICDDVFDQISLLKSEGQTNARKPFSVFELLDGACALAQNEAARLPEPGSAKVTAAHVTKIAEDLHGLAISKPGCASQDPRDTQESGALAAQDLNKKFLGLAEALKQRVFGQDEAVTSLSEALLRFQMGISDPSRPIGSFLFLGGSGVGKTQLAKALALELHGSEKSLIRLDMSEYKEQHCISRLIGSPPGYVGHNEGGQLTRQVAENPKSVILFDEVEKAHVTIFDTLLQVLDDGRLTDGKGQVIDFSQTLIIMTSNLGARNLQSEPRFEVAKEIALGEARRHFLPEFINRLDDLIVFKPLSEDLLLGIVQSQVDKLNERLQKKKIELLVDSEALKFILDNSFNPMYGARPIRRYIDKHIGTSIAKMMAQETLPSDGIVRVSLDAGALTFSKMPVPKEPEEESFHFPNLID